MQHLILYISLGRLVFFLGKTKQQIAKQSSHQPLQILFADDSLFTNNINFINDKKEI